jgi:hypothetical protein
MRSLSVAEWRTDECDHFAVQPPVLDVVEDLDEVPLDEVFVAHGADSVGQNECGPRVLTLRDELDCGASQMQECIAKKADDPIGEIRRWHLRMCAQNTVRWNSFPWSWHWLVSYRELVQLPQKKLVQNV